MDLSNIIYLFFMGFLIGLAFRLFYSKMTGKLQPKKLTPVSKVKYISPKLDDIEMLDERRKPCAK